MSTVKLHVRSRICPARSWICPQQLHARSRICPARSRICQQHNYMPGAGFVRLGVGYVHSTITCSEPDLSMRATSHLRAEQIELGAIVFHLDIKEDTNSKRGDINSFDTS